MDIKMKNGFDQIKISDRLDEVVNHAFNRAKNDKRKRKSKLNIIISSISVASIIIVFIMSVNYMPVFAESIKNIPIISAIAHAVQINYSRNIGNSINEGYAENIELSKMAGEIKIDITNVLADDKSLYIVYALDGKKDTKGLKNLLLNNLKITDERNNVLIDTNNGKDISQVLTNMTEGKQGDFLIPMNSYGYNCVVASLGNSLQSYLDKQETKGIIQLSADSGKIIPKEINITFSGFTEAYNTSYSKQSYADFISKFNRNPISLNIDCSFNVKLDKKLKTITPETYNNIRFTSNNTEFEIRYLNVYPTYIEAKVQLGKNKVNNSQCVSIINKIGLDTSTLPYLEDESGNKYMPHRSHIAMDSDNCQTITFESSYFNKSNELYLVVNQLTYMNGALDKVSTKVRIK